jgi:signal transduction histidine kinase
MDRMTTSGDFSAGYLRRLRANWPAVLLPLVAVGTRGLTANTWPELVIVLALILVVVAPRKGAAIAPYPLFAYGAYGLFLMHSLLIREANSVTYGFVHASWRPVIVGANWYPVSSPWDRCVLAEAVACLAVGVWLLARPGSLGGGPVRRAVAQLRGTGGQPRTVPPLMLIGVIFLWEELFAQNLWFGAPWQPGITPMMWQPGIAPMMLSALLIAAAGVAAVVWLPRVAAVLAVAGAVLIGLIGVLAGVQWLWDPRSAPVGPWSGYTIGFYGAVPLDGGITRVFAGLEGVALVAVGCALAPRLLTWSADFELAERARALTRRVDGLTRTRRDATETAVAELRRIERDLHDGAQARLVAVGMSLRAVEQLIGSNPEAALALVAEARETSSRALADLRDLVRGIYPPVLADRGLAEAVRNLALDTLVDVAVAVELPGEPPMPVAAAVYFAVAEALANAARHAAARTAAVSVEHADGRLSASVTDDGRGGADASRGTGLAGVERRLATFDGILRVSSPAGGPTVIAIEVPCALSSVKISSC